MDELPMVEVPPAFWKMPDAHARQGVPLDLSALPFQRGMPGGAGVIDTLSKPLMYRLYT